MDICDNLRDDQDFKTGKWCVYFVVCCLFVTWCLYRYEIRKKCPHFFAMLKYQYPAEPVPLQATYNGYRTAELDIRLVLAFIGRLFVPLNVFERW